MKKKDLIAEEVEQRKKRAIILITQVTDIFTKALKEPVREGIPKGEKIGPSISKVKAAFFMALHPVCLKLAGVAKLAGTYEGVLKVWRTTEEFKSLEEIALRRLGELFLNTIEKISNEDETIQIKKGRDEGTRSEFAGKLLALNLDGKIVIKILRSEKECLNGISFKNKELIVEIDDLTDWSEKMYLATPAGMSGDDYIFYLADILSILNLDVSRPLLKVFKDRSDQYRLAYIAVVGVLIRNTSVFNMKSYREWIRQPEMIDLFKSSIETSLRIITDPEARKSLGAKALKKTVKDLKKSIFDTLDILAS
jgi:hypothetical protein